MSEEYVAFFAIGGFAIVFPAFWVLVTAFIAEIGGWNRAQRNHPDKPNAEVIETLHMRSANLGHPYFGVSYGGCLTFQVCDKGLRIKVWKLFAPFSKPIFVDWDHLKTVPARWLLWRVYGLRWGLDKADAIFVFRSTARDIADASRSKFVLRED